MSLAHSSTVYSQFSPCGHPAITDTSIQQTAVESQGKIDYRHLTEVNSRYYGLSLIRKLTRGPWRVRYTVLYCIGCCVSDHEMTQLFSLKKNIYLLKRRLINN